jgi:hypothetical protein
MMNPLEVAANRSARLVREAHTPVYSTDTTTAAHKARIETLARADGFAGEDWCFICSRPTDHRGEHDDEQLLAFARSRRGQFFMP